MKHYYVWNIINVPNKPDYYKVTSPFNAMQVIEKVNDSRYRRSLSGSLGEQALNVSID